MCVFLPRGGGSAGGSVGAVESDGVEVWAWLRGAVGVVGLLC